MQRAKVLGVALMAVFAIGAITATGASAHKFASTESPGLVIAKAEGLQSFTTPTGTVACNALAGDGAVTGLETLSQNLMVTYTECSVLIGGSWIPQASILAEYLFNADNEEARLLSAINIVVNFGTKCTITVPAQNSLKSVTYKNTGKRILVASNVSNIESSDSGATCPVKYTSNKTGKYVGNALSELSGTGTLSWS